MGAWPTKASTLLRTAITRLALSAAATDRAGRDRPCGRPPAEHIETYSDAVNPGAPCRAARPCPQAEQIAKPTERDARLAGFFVFPAIGRLVPFQLFEPSRRKRILAEGPGARVSASLADQVGTALGRRRWFWTPIRFRCLHLTWR